MWTVSARIAGQRMRRSQTPHGPPRTPDGPFATERPARGSPTCYNEFSPNLRISRSRSLKPAGQYDGRCRVRCVLTPRKRAATASGALSAPLAGVREGNALGCALAAAKQARAAGRVEAGEAGARSPTPHTRKPRTRPLSRGAAVRGLRVSSPLHRSGDVSSSAAATAERRPRRCPRRRRPR